MTQFTILILVQEEIITEMNLQTYWWKPHLDRSSYVSLCKSFPHVAHPGILLRNFGDSLNSNLLDHLIGRDNFKWQSERLCDFTSIGSILNRVLEKSQKEIITVWGSGLRDSNMIISRGDLVKFKFISARGLLTAKAFNCGVNTSFGDPGLLVSLISGAEKVPIIEILFVPHFSFHFRNDSKEILRNLRSRGFTIGYTSHDVFELIEKIGQSKLVISSALHILVAADSLGIPSIRLINSDNHETDFKFQDYLSAIGEKSEWPALDLADLMKNFIVDESLLEIAKLRISNLKSSILEVKLNLLESLNGWLKQIR